MDKFPLMQGGVSVGELITEQEALYKRAQVILSEQAASVWIQDLCDLTVMDPALEGLTLYRTYVLDMSTIRYAG